MAQVPQSQSQSPSLAPGPLLPAVVGPVDVRGLSADELLQLAGEIRQFLVEKVCATGGHLGPNLGVVELTLALHRVFDSPHDTLIFDTGHQAYAHKLLTGRRTGFERLRQPGGLSGYPSRSESGHDLVENSHASTALAYADGLAKARQLAGEVDRAVVAVIGDGALSGGLAFEAFNNLGAAKDRPVIVVVNDNGRSYAPTSGALAAHLNDLRFGGGLETCHNFFTDLGFTYFGPVDGHHTGELEQALARARAMNRPTVVHAFTVKGKGYEPAEQDTADCLHAVGVVDPATGRPTSPPAPGVAGTPTTARPSWTSVFSRSLLHLAEQREEVVAVTASMLRPTGLHAMAERFPQRVFDVGIAEQQAVTSAAGLAMGGYHPIVAIYATFLNRAFDQVLMDVAMHRLPVTFVLDRAGITGPDGPSHHGMWDLSVFSTVPGLRIAAPRDATRLEELLSEAVAYGEGPSLLRFPKGPAPAGLPAVERLEAGDVLHCSLAGSRDVLLVAAGPMGQRACEAARELEEFGIGATVIDPRWLLPIQPALTDLAARHRLVVTIEDNLRHGGMGTALLQSLNDRAARVPLVRLGLPQAFIEHGSREGLLEQAGLSAEAITNAVLVARSTQVPIPPADQAPVQRPAPTPQAARQPAPSASRRTR
ncbi:1-deoxy-D-xylulose-5-phosphate synthase (plasmid) [Streptomyces sp. YIM 121038]|uniref:1-deoxy-D-xylulose-5-phosphate synthase n=1 Tax=Streptomyces sp. YIM 121038 TaxID=2136401 RepID=UPI001110C340|nr:1-deoxy-D-xylulose-5-phosphate synthase [Streptomyces sp. YIM 121038]QCX82375.1 1-deoxy-D-xylulose-5-phosphate synthase [Streptomyces sp. YIM 121038]